MFKPSVTLKNPSLGLEISNMDNDETIRIHHECKGEIENRPADHRSASRGLPSDDYP